MVINQGRKKYACYLVAGIVVVIAVMLSYQATHIPWNSPYPWGATGENVLYRAFSEQPKHLDPAKSYSSDEYQFIAQIYEPPLQYHYLKRPYQLIPLTATKRPQPQYYDNRDNRLPNDAPATDIAYTDYVVDIQPGILFQNHPAFVVDLAAEPRDDERVHRGNTWHSPVTTRHAFVTPQDFSSTATRELTAADYVYQIKRLASPQLHSPILGMMKEQIIGLDQLAETLRQQAEEKNIGPSTWFDLRPYSLAGAKVIDRYRYRIRIKGKDPQFLYWLAMPFFSPMAWEVERFYQQPGFLEKNLTLNWYPVGTGPYMLIENNPNRRMVLARNPNFRGEAYPNQGEAGDQAQGLLEDAGKSMPFIDRVIFSLEKESIPSWTKFLQGYYDRSGIASDNFEQAIHLGSSGEASLSPALKEKQITLQTASAATTFYWGFNWLDPVVGGNSERARKLRQAISMAMDMEEYISIFLNGRAIAAQGPLPPGIFGYRDGRAGLNPVVYRWDGSKKQRRALSQAKQLLAEAGYPNGVARKTGKPLVLHYDVVASGGPDDKARLSWMVKQFKKLNITLIIRSTHYSRFREKMQNGQAQIFSWGWHADYPDPENFFLLLYGPNAKAKFSGENAANYHNPQFDRLYLKMKDMENGPARQEIIDQMLEIVRNDAPWIWGLHPTNYLLSHSWNRVSKPNELANNTLKYQRLDPTLRQRLQQQWNRPIVWPLLLALLFVVITALPVFLSYRQKMLRPSLERLP